MKKFIAIILAVVTILSCFSIIAGAEDIVASSTDGESVTRDFEQGDIVTFGTYPQSKVTDTKLIVSLNKEVENLGYSGNDYTSFKYYNGRYLDVEFEGEWYRGYFTTDIFSTDWYKFEPIEWIVLDPVEGYVISRYAIDIKLYDTDIKSMSNRIYEEVKNKDCIEEKKYTFNSYNITLLNGEEINRSISNSYNIVSGFSALTFNEIFDYNNILKNYKNLSNGTDYISKYNINSFLEDGWYCYNFSYNNKIRSSNGSYFYIPTYTNDALRFSNSPGYAVERSYDYNSYINVFFSNNLWTINNNQVGTSNYYSNVGFRPTCTVDLASPDVSCSHTRESIIKEEVAKNSTCTEKGSKKLTYKCDCCGEERIEYEDINALGHSFTNYVYNNDATCLKDGTETAKCDRCEKTNTKTSSGTKIPHTVVIDEAKEPTCSAAGLTEGSHCLVCGTVITAQKTINNTAHSYYWKITEEPTCKTMKGVKTYTCKYCDKNYYQLTGSVIVYNAELNKVMHYCYEYSEVVSHDFYLDEENSYESSHEEDGIYTYVCKNCGKVKFEAQEPLNHRELELIEEKETTCMEDGYKKYKCPDCEYTYTEWTHHSGHNYVTTVVAPTCCTMGYTIYKCSKCEDTYIDDYTDMLPHTNLYTIKENVIEPTCIKDGSHDLVTYCRDCGVEVSRETIYDNNDSHNYEEKIIDPTFEEDGYTICVCKNCGDIGSIKYNVVSKYLYGDIDKDNNVTVSDARLCLRQAIKLESYESGSREYTACDFDKDNNITVSDARIILRTSIGLA